jgi:predicted membrane protein
VNLSLSVILTFQSFDHHVFGIDVVVALFQFLFKTFDHVFTFLGHLNNTQRQQKKTPRVRSDRKKQKKVSNKNQEPNKKQGFKNVSIEKMVKKHKAHMLPTLDLSSFTPSMSNSAFSTRW